MTPGRKEVSVVHLSDVPFGVAAALLALAPLAADVPGHRPPASAR